MDKNGKSTYGYTKDLPVEYSFDRATGKSTPTGRVFSQSSMPPVVTQQQNPNTIAPSDLKQTSQVQLPPAVNTQPAPVQNMTTGYLETLNLNEKERAAQEYQVGGIEQLLKDTLELSNQEATRAEEMKKAGVQVLKQDLQGINSKILQKQAEIAQDDITLVSNMRAEERRDTLLPFAEMGKAKLAGDAAIMRALKTSEIGVLNATALAKQGDIALAQQTAEDAVNAKYAPYKARIERYDTVIKALSPFLTSAEKKEATAQAFKGQMALKEIEKVSDFQKTALNNAILNGAPQDVLNKINSASSMEGIMEVGSKYLVSPKEALELQKLRLDVTKSNADAISAVQALNSAKQTIGGTTGDVAVDLILGSSQYKGKQPSAGWIDDFTQAGVALGNVQELQKLIEKQGSTGIIQGNVAGLLGKLSGGFANASAINAQIQRTVPGLARGIFKEVGVLTDQDISNYKKTLPNLTSPEQQNKLALLATYDVIERSMALSLANQAKAKNDVSGYYQDYYNVKNQVRQLKSELGFVETTPIDQTNRAKLDGMWGNSVVGNVSATLDNLTR